MNAIHHIINHIQIQRFARAQHQKVFIFPALHTHTQSSSPTNLRLYVDDLLGIPKQGTKVPSPGLLLYTASMPAMVLTNISTQVGLVNRASGRAIGIIINSTGA
jgi:hypothetical protein